MPCSKRRSRTAGNACTIVFFVLMFVSPILATEQSARLLLRASGVPTNFGVGPIEEGERQVVDAFRRRFPDIEPVPTSGLVLPGDRSQDMLPFMQIAGDIPPHVMSVNFRQSHTYISMKLLYPLDHYVESLAGVSLPDGSALRIEEYFEALKSGKGWAQIETRVPAPCWPVMRRRCPYEQLCPYRAANHVVPLAAHSHVWMYPVGPLTAVMYFDRTLLAEHLDEGIETRTPKDWEELLRWSKLLTDPEKNTYGMRALTGVGVVPAWAFCNFLYSVGGEVVEQNQRGDWHCVIDSEAAVEAGYFWARLHLEKVIRNGKFICRGVVNSSESSAGAEPIRTGFAFTYLDDRFFQAAADQSGGLGPVPAGPTGLRRSVINAMMLGIFAGADTRHRDASWEYIQFRDGEEARRIRTVKMIEAGLGPYVRRELLEQFNEGGRYDSIIRRIPPDLEETYKTAISGGVPEPYGKNCQYVYDEMNKPLSAILSSPVIRDAIDRGDATAAKAEIRAILRRATERINERMLGNLPPAVAAQRTGIAWIVIVGVVAIFAVVFTLVFKAFMPSDSHRRPVDSPASNQRNRGWRAHRSIRAWMMMAPALILIAIWMYWPLIKGSAIAFQDYSVMGDSKWIGAGNFAAVLYSSEFWHSMRVSLYYAIMFFVFGFWVPIGLAVLLSEVPRGKLLFRAVYYLPAVLSGVVVLFLWKSFYSPDGMINQLLNGGVWLLNQLPRVQLSYFNNDWLQNPHLALFFCLLPTVWAGMGPGCLIYLAALKTIPDELYEAADLDGAGIRYKLFYIALPTIKILILINFIGAMIGAIRGAGGFMLAMTGGGPFGEGGGATEVVGLKIFYTTFGHLQFGTGAAMSWVLGSMLIGFTVLQLKRMSSVEFRTAKAH